MMTIDGKSISEYLMPWFHKSELDILKEFHSLSPNSVVIGENYYTSVFVPGTRSDRALLVAHIDTVWKDSKKIKVRQTGNLLRSDAVSFTMGKNNVRYIHGIGFGADDRAGCAMLWALRELGHSLLLTGAEEIGCVGSSYMMSIPEVVKLVSDHQFAIQVDRKNHDDLVFYKVSTPDFRSYCEKETGYRTEKGTFSDIAVLCEDICGVNISTGYRNEHTPNEILNLLWWEDTYSKVGNWLSKKGLERFTRKK